MSQRGNFAGFVGANLPRKGSCALWVFAQGWANEFAPTRRFMRFYVGANSFARRLLRDRVRMNPHLPMPDFSRLS